MAVKGGVSVIIDVGGECFATSIGEDPAVGDRVTQGDDETLPAVDGLVDLGTHQGCGRWCRRVRGSDSDRGSGSIRGGGPTGGGGERGGGRRLAAKQHVDGRAARGGGAVPQLAVGVVSPALEDATRRQGAGVIGACGHGGHAAGEAGDVDGGAAFILAAAVPQLTVVVPPPALDAAPGGQGTGVNGAGRHGSDAAGEAGDIDGRGAPGSGAVPQLAVGIVPPALEAATAGEGAGVIVACGHGGHATDGAADVDGGGPVVGSPALDAARRCQGAGPNGACGQGGHAAGEAGDVDGRVTMSGGAIPQLAIGVVPPAFDAALSGQGAGVLGASGHGGHAAGQTGHVDGGGARVDGAVSQLTVVVPAPALDAARGGEGAGVEIARGHGGDAAGEPGDVDGGVAIGGSAVPQLAIPVVPPAFEPARCGQSAGVVPPRGYGRGVCCRCRRGAAKRVADDPGQGLSVGTRRHHHERTDEQKRDNAKQT